MDENLILQNLNPQQKAAVENYQGPCLIVAGAGSGKTKVLTSRIAYLISKGVNPERVLALTFTKKAAEEMKERIGAMIGFRSARHLQMGTFHSVFCKILRDFHEEIGYSRDFTIYDTSATKSAITAILKEMNLDADKKYDVRKITSRISMAKNNFVTPQVYKNNHKLLEEDAKRLTPLFFQVYERYAEKCKTSNVMDFDDILLNLDLLVQNNPDATKSIAGRFDYILVDEYQDTNFAQYYIIKKLAQWHRNICVVGDDSQSIYAFRGANISNIFDFKKEYPDFKMYRLERNYRSTQTIVSAANSLIEHNQNRIPKECYSEGEEGRPIDIISTFDEKEEALLVVSNIVSRMAEQKAQYSDFALLYRTNAQSRTLEEALRRRNIPYIIYSGRSFYEREEVMDLLSYFRLVVNPHDDEAFKRICNKPSRGISPATVAKLVIAANDNHTSLIRAAYLEDLGTRYDLKTAALNSLKTFCDLISRLSSIQPTTDAFTLANRIAEETGYRNFRAEDKTLEGIARLANVDELLSGVKAYVKDMNEEFAEIQLEENGSTEVNEDELPVVTLSSYIENVALLSAVDVDDETNNKVALMTVHASKGLEFTNVYITGLEEELFPACDFMTPPQEIEEERRLMYVAMTRAQKTLTLSYAKRRMRRGTTMTNSPSRFIREIDRKYFSTTAKHALIAAMAEKASEPQYNTKGMPVGYPYNQPQRPAAQQPQRLGPAPRPAMQSPEPKPVTSAVPQNMHLATLSELQVGVTVYHEKFGQGTITQLLTDGMYKVIVKFDKYGTKTLIPSYAKLLV